MLHLFIRWATPILIALAIVAALVSATSRTSATEWTEEHHALSDVVYEFWEATYGRLFIYEVQPPLRFISAAGDLSEGRAVVGCVQGVAYLLHTPGVFEPDADGDPTAMLRVAAHELAHAVHCVETDAAHGYGPNTYPQDFLDSLSDYCRQPSETWACFAEQRPHEALAWFRSSR